MQKLVTIYLDHENRKEHLEKELADGWRVVQLVGVGVAFDEEIEDSTGYMAVLLEKDG